jgi:hypothetical protein
VWASGSQVWNGHIGTLIAKPRKMPRNAQVWKVVEPNGAISDSSWMLQVLAPAWK